MMAQVTEAPPARPAATICRSRGETRTTTEGPAAAGWVTMVIDAAGLLDGAGIILVRQGVPSRSPRCADDELRGVHLAGEVVGSAVARRRRPRCAWSRRLVAARGPCPSCGADTPARPSPRIAANTISSALDFDAIRVPVAPTSPDRAAGHGDGDAFRASHVA